MAKSGRVRAIVKVVLEVEADSVWGTDSTWDQISKQAEADVEGLLTNSNPLSLKDIPRKIRSIEMVAVRVQKEG